MTKFERHPFDESEVEDNVKVCMFYLLKAVLLACDKRKLVSRDHFMIMQNPKLRERYPWGRCHMMLQSNHCVAQLITATPPTLSSIGSPPYASSPHASPATAQYAISEDVARGVHQSVDSLGGSPIADTDPVKPAGGSPTIQDDIVEPSERAPTLTYDLDLPIKESRRRLLMDFLDDSSRSNHNVDIMVLDKSNFQTTLTSGAWLGSDKRIHDHRDLFIERVAIVDVFFWESLYYCFEAHAPVMQIKYIHPSERPPIPSRDWTCDANDNTLTNYMKSISPLLSCSWKDVNRVYVPINNEDKHWLVAEVDLVRRHITLYDSSCTISNDWFQICNDESL
ncbi:hypothetical protein FNV43_RR21668 [Rhamnella rubrinervis]|uniref:Ubiquitin-like protease family profile domain-containing protein n=1 Tax=Rhamnella rubrinervis TaxID=2594499 RepID=A0A8K0DUQ0_9ROSA|nr:hypothetical protein FNV43_RR21668 [Rhamnella rubrinervis]